MTIRILTLAFACAAVTATHAQQKPPTPTNGSSPKPAGVAPAPAAVATPANYIIGPDDILAVVFWREKDMSAEVVVRPDGKISLPLLNEVQATGLTPEQLRVKVTEAASKYVEDPTVTVVVKQINSVKVFITGQVYKPGPYPLPPGTTVLQMIAMAGGLLEYANQKDIMIMRTENGQPRVFKFNYKDVTKGKNVKQNIVLQPGDTIVVR